MAIRTCSGTLAFTISVCLARNAHLLITCCKATVTLSGKMIMRKHKGCHQLKLHSTARCVDMFCELLTVRQICCKHSTTEKCIKEDIVSENGLHEPQKTQISFEACLSKKNKEKRQNISLSTQIGLISP